MTGETETFDIHYGPWCGPFLGLLGMGRRFSGVVVGPDSVDVTMGWAFGTRIPRAAITSVAVDDARVWGWGVHGWGGRWLVNGSSTGLVRIEIDPPVRSKVCFVPVRLRTLRVSVADRDPLVAALS